MIDRDRFAADIYLRLLETLSGKDPQWLKDESFRRADEFIEEAERQQPSKSKRRQREIVNA